MLVIADNISQILEIDDPLVGFFGSPPRESLLFEAAKHRARLVDLDVDYSAQSVNLVPKAYCHILRNCVDNAAALKDRLVSVVAATGKEKCDGGRFAAWMIREKLGLEVLFTECTQMGEAALQHLCETKGPLKKRVIRIMRSIVEPLTSVEKAEAANARGEATHGFWGTPPHPIEILDLFPDTTHIFGWTRCVEAERPADLELECAVQKGLPIVFFSQGFCQKAALAKHLAETHGGIHVDVHDTLNAAITAKIEAFIRLSIPRRIG